MDIEKLDAPMKKIWEDHRYHWCDVAERGWCGCTGCANSTVKMAGGTRADWEAWVAKNPRRIAD